MAKDRGHDGYASASRDRAFPERAATPDSIHPPTSDLGACRLLAEQMRDIMLVIRPSDWRILDVNSAAIASYGWSREVLLTKTLSDLRASEQGDTIDAQLRQADREGILFEAVHVRADGSRFPVEVSAQGAELSGQRVVISLVRDVSQRKLAEDRLRRSHDTFFSLIQNAPFGVNVIDSRFRLLQASAGSRKVFDGVHPLIGRDFAELLRLIWSEPFASEAIAHFRHTLATGEAYHSPATIERRAGVNDVEAYDWRLERVTLPDGEFGVVCYFYDLSERRRHENDLRESQERQRIAVESARLGVIEWHIADDIALWENDRPYEIFGRPRAMGPVGREEFIRTYVVPEDREAFAARTSHDIRVSDRVCWNVRIRRSDGEVRWIEVTGNITRTPDGAPARMLGVISDITERVAGERALRESEARFRELANAMPQLVWTADNQGRVTYYNSQAAKYSGLELGPDGVWRWEPLAHPEDLDATERAWAHAVQTGSVYQCEHRVKMRDGSYRWHLSRAFRSSDASQWFGTATEVHDLKQAEEQLRANERELAHHKADLERRVQERTEELTATYERLRFSERLATMGTLAAGLGHDLGNLLVPVRVRLESLAQSALDEHAREDVEAIRTSAEYLRRLAQGLRLLALDPERAARGEVTQIHSWWHDVYGVLKSAVPREIEVVCEIDPHTGSACISKPALTQVVFNILQNAGDAMRERGHGRIQVRARKAHSSVTIVVEDNGPGMSPDVKARCMEPYFTTKSRGISTGIGLVLVYGLIRDAGGTVQLESDVGVGTRFTLVLPASPAEAPPTGPKATCIVDIKDARVRSIISGELVAHNVEPHAWDSRDGQESIAITDDPIRLEALPAGARALLLATSTSAPPNVRVLGDRPNIGEIRDAIRTIVGLRTLNSTPH